MITPFGSEVQFLNDRIVTATDKQFNLAGKPMVKFIIRWIGLPHFGARVRAYYLKQLISHLPSPSKVLDAGCGIGLNAFLAARSGHNVTGVDTDKEKIRLAKCMAKAAHQPVGFHVDDITRMKLPNNSFDAIVCFEVLEHIKQDTKAIRELSRVLKTGGMLLLSVPSTGPISKINQEIKHHVREGYDVDKLTSMLKDYGFANIRVIPIEHTLLGFLVRYLNDEFGRQSLLLATLCFPIFLPLGILDGFLPPVIKPNNIILIAQKKS